MPRRSQQDPNQIKLFSIEDYLKTAPCVPLLRQHVTEWRDKDYRGATDITRELLHFWFQQEHRLSDGRRFEYHRSQRDAIETIIYAYEIAQVRTRTALIEQFARNSGELRLPPGDDDFARYAIKMATGSGKTKVMSLAIVWQYWNAIMRGNDQDYARNFLIIAPNVIVFERLKTDFAGGRIFRIDPLMPSHLRYLWDVDCVMRGEGDSAYSSGVLYLTNIQQLYERPEKANGDEPEAMTAVLGPRPPADLNKAPDLAERMQSRDGSLLIINDEAHHTHDEESKWNEAIDRFHAIRPITSQLDFSATPRYQNGTLFPWTISDYPLKQAIIDGVVKRPFKGIANINEVTSDSASTRYEGFITAAVHRWREYREQLAPIGKKPLLFIMLNSTDEADDVGDYLRTKYPDELGGDKTLIIHTKGNGDIKEKDLDAARRVAREVDEATSPVNAIVSVLMLREGWDVQNVTVILGLRPYSAKANILPEQTIGRGLRLMFRGQGVTYTERVDIIGNKAFLQFIDDLDRLEETKIDEFEIGKDPIQILTIQPVPEKILFDISIPEITPVLQRKTSLSSEIATLDVMAFDNQPLPLKEGDIAERTFRYEGKDIITMATEFEREYTIPPVKTAGEVIGFYARIIAKDLKLPSQFAALVPKLKEFFIYKAFSVPVDLEDETVIRAMSRPQVGYVVRKVFAAALRDIIIEPLEPELTNEVRKLSDLAPYPFMNTNALEGRRCVLNYAPCSNAFERDFGKFLDAAGDVTTWCKLPDPFRFAIDYMDPSASLRSYYPDFIAITDDGTHWIVETKGAETIEVAAKDNAAKLWCENATHLTGTPWRYLKVQQKAYQQLAPGDFADLRMI